jgi:diguanylate cyclase (GGDEF)-like protein
MKNTYLHKMFYSWRYYGFGKERYYGCIGNLFVHNLIRLRQVNVVISIIIGSFSLFPLLVRKNFVMAGVYLAVALIALFIFVYSHYMMQKAQKKNDRFIYWLMVLFYANIMFFGIYLSVWSSPDKLASIFLCFLICALLIFINPPFLNLGLTLSAMAAFIVSVVMVKTPDNIFLDIINVLIAGAISLYFNWHIPRLRLGLELSANMLEDERNIFFDQSTIDDLTKLKNRRDFMQTFQRYLSNYRTSDDWLCIAICDVDFFKNYNDYYGHPMGDDCLRSIGGVLNDLTESMGVYTARVGGEEFAMLWFENDVSSIEAVVFHISGKISALNIPHEKSKVCTHITLSIGIYMERCGSSTNVHALYDLADKALYTAKESGRNCAIVSGRDIKEYKIIPVLGK